MKTTIKYFSVIFALMICFAFTISPTSYSQEVAPQWKQVVGTTSHPMNSITYGNGLFVQVGRDGSILTSKDGLTWTAQESNSESHLNHVLWNDSLFLATGTSGEILTSPDGISWTRQPRFSNSEISFSTVAWNGTVFVGMTDYFGSLYTSSDGITWTFHKRFFTKEYLHFREIIWDGQQFLALSKELNGVYLYTSTDGIDWTRLASQGIKDILDANSIAYNGKTYVITGQSETKVYVSDNLKSFKHIKVNGFYLTGVKSFGKQFVIVGDNHNYTPNGKLQSGNIMTSPDGYKWTALPNLTKNRVTDISYNGSVYVATTASEALIGSEAHGAVLTSSNGVKWKEHILDTQEAFTSVATNGKILIAANSKGFILRSTDGVKWSRTAVDAEPISKIIWDGKQFILAGIGIFTSPDGLKWTKTTPTYNTAKITKDNKAMLFSKGKLSGRISDLQYNGKQYIAVGEWGLIMTSPNLKAWTLKKSNTLKWIDTVAYDGKRYVANTDDLYTKLLVSTDGTTWKAVSLGKKYFSNSIRSNGNDFVMICTDAVGEVTAQGVFVNKYRYKSFILTSTDGIKWSTKDMKHYDAYHSLSFTGQEYIITSSTVILSSKDGKTWTSITPSIYRTVMGKDAIRFNDQLYTVGINGSILVMTQ